MTCIDDTNSTRYELATVIPHCPVMLVLDTSHSMWGQGLTDMTASIHTFYKTIAAEEFPDAQLDIAAVSMGDNLCMLEEFTPITQSVLPAKTIRPKGDTPIGAALNLAVKKIEEQISGYQQNGTAFVTPHLILLSDGKSTDDFTAVAAMLRRASQAGKIVCRAIAMGDADMDALEQIAGENVMSPDYGSMRDHFAEVGKLITRTYEEEAPDVMMDQFSRQVQTVSGHSREYLLDGSNILHWDEYRSGITLNFLLSITDYLKAKGMSFQVYFDATARHLLKSAEKAQYESLLKTDPDHFRQVPAGTRADDFLLVQADGNPESMILTQDLFRDHKAKYPWVTDRSRVVSGMVMNGKIFFPQISLEIPVNRAENSTMYSL